MTLITKNDIPSFTFSPYRKTTTTDISRETLPVGTRVATLEGEYMCSEPSRLAIDVAGNVYPIAESVLAKSYEEVHSDGS